MDYLTALDILHTQLAPQNYVEIGCRTGISLARARCPVLAIDPDFEITSPLTAPTRLFRETSDDFFANRDLSALLGGPVHLAFVDGMHQAEFVLRDILNLERHCDEGSVIVVDDVLPREISWASRIRETQAWTGDVYKVIPFLRQYRPDLEIEVFDIEMKGLAIIHNLTPGGRPFLGDQAEHEARLAGPELALETADEIRRVLAPHPAKMLADRAGALPTRRQTHTPAPDRPQAAYLDLLKRSLLNEIYLDDELRLQYLRDCLSGQDDFDYGVLHDIREHRRDAFDEMKASRQIGRFPERSIQRSGFGHTMMGRLRLDSLHDCLDHIHRNAIPGDLIECGVWRGGGCILMAGYLSAHAIRDRQILVADSFDGLPKPSHEADKALDLSKEKFPELAVSEATVRENFAAYGLLGDNVTFLNGWFRDTLASAPTDQIALLRLDGDLYESTMDTLTALYDKVPEGGIVIVDDFGGIQVCEQAVRDFFNLRGEVFPQIREIDWTGVYWVKQTVKQEGP